MSNQISKVSVFQNFCPEVISSVEGALGTSDGEWGGNQNVRAVRSSGPPAHRFVGVCLFVCFLIFFNVYLFLREREYVRGRGAAREGDTESNAGYSL